MPESTYNADEVERIVRVAYATCVRDILQLIQGGPLNGEQADVLSTFITDMSRLRDTKADILRLATATYREDLYKRFMAQRAKVN